jgi:hypothetical protein
MSSLGPWSEAKIGVFTNLNSKDLCEWKKKRNFAHGISRKHTKRGRIPTMSVGILCFLHIQGENLKQ